MKKIITICFVIFSLFMLFGCKKEEKKDLFYLDDKFYNNGEYIKIKSDEFNKLEDNAYIVYTYNSYCSMKIPCETVFKKTMEKYNIDFYYLSVLEMKKTFIYDTVKYAPSVVIIKDNKVIAYLDAESDEQFDYYQDDELFESWLSQYIYLEKEK